MQSRNYLLNKRINWHFISPRAPYLGGLWAAAARSLEHNVIFMVGNTSFAYEELSTNVIAIEVNLKFRPLIPLFSVPNDLDPLKISRFLNVTDERYYIRNRSIVPMVKNITIETALVEQVA